MQDMSKIGVPLGFDSVSTGHAINQLGEIAGEAVYRGIGQHAFLYSKGEMKDLGTLGGTLSVALGINKSQKVVGYSSCTGDAAQHAMIYTTATGMIDLNSEIPNDSGWVFIECNGDQ
jgi:probable HAF family extracellular repeat protein